MIPFLNKEAPENIQLFDQPAYKIQIYAFSNPELDENKKISIIEFPAFITDFSDSYKSSWSDNSVIGRMDPIVTFKNTRRNISLSFDLPSEDATQSKIFLDNIDYIIRGLYPVYDDGKFGTAVMSSPPIFRVRFANFIRNAAESNQTANSSIPSTLRDGLMCYFNSFSFKPKVEAGFFVTGAGQNLYPKLISVSLELNILHEHPLSKTVNGQKIVNRDGFNNFPRLDPNKYSLPNEAAFNVQEQQRIQNELQANEAKKNEQNLTAAKPNASRPNKRRAKAPINKNVDPNCDNTTQSCEQKALNFTPATYSHITQPPTKVSYPSSQSSDSSTSLPSGRARFGGLD